MKKNILLLTLIIFAAQVSFAQLSTPYSIGYIGGGPKEVSTSTYRKDQIYFNGPTIMSNGTILTKDTNNVLVGMPYGVGFFPLVFSKPLRASKGYFSDYVFLQWTISALESRIKKILIYRKEVGAKGDSTLVATLASTESSWKDEYGEKGTLYKYTVYLQGIADGLNLTYINVVEDIGFSFPIGTASGRITFEGGTSVEGVTVAAETQGNLRGRSLSFNGTNQYLTIPHNMEDEELELRKGFTFQAWLKLSDKTSGVIMNKGADYELAHSASDISFKVGNTTLSLPFTAPVDTFFHVSAVYRTDSMFIYVNVNADKKYAIAAASGSQPDANLTGIQIARNSSGSYFKGNIDEIRLWNKALTKTEVRTYFDKYIVGNETNLAGYWRLNEGAGKGFYDFSRVGTAYNNNNGYLWNSDTTSWSDVTPMQSQLSFKGITDANGNYVISGFPYETSGSQYTFTPMLGVHKFDPYQAIRFVGTGASIHNSVDFKDISSFKVSGTVRYENSYFPVEGVSILVDGKSAVTSEGSLILTDNLGRFTVDIPIGEHSFKLSKNLHTFQNEGRFPIPSYDGEVTVFNYNAPVNGLEFIDVTRVKVAGKIVGGPVESAKKLGFGLTKNNIGQGTIYITSQKGYDLTVADSTSNYTEAHFNAQAKFSTKYVTVKADATTGEYVAYLPPETYVVTNVTAGDYVFDENSHVTVNLQQFIALNEVKEDTVMLAVKGVDQPNYPTYDSTKYLKMEKRAKGDSVWTVGIDSFFYDKKQDFILRNKPTITVANGDGTQIFGEQSFTYTDDIKNINQTIPLVNSGNYLLGYPIFEQRKSYKILVSLQEEYTNANTGIVDKVPVVDGSLEIVNDMAINTDPVEVEMNSLGKATYSFTAGLPNIAVNNQTPELSFTKVLNITAISGENGSIRTIWRENNPFRGIVFGGMPTGNNFVTTGPKDLITILRDPPGSNSSAFLEKGQTITRTKTWDVSNSFSQSTELDIKLGAEVKVFAGVGAGTITETEYQNDIKIGFESEETWTNSNEQSSSITTTQNWSTSGESNFVGPQGDVFVGYGTNIVYGKSEVIQLIPKGECTQCIGDSINGYRMGIKVGIRMNPQFGTSFIYTQKHIEENLIPDLVELRNTFLNYSGSPDTVKNTTITQPVYISKVSPTDPKFGSSNTDKEVWGDLAITDNTKLGNGPSYKVIVPANWPSDKQIPDTVFFYNRAIKEWKDLLALNEEVKVKATLDKNISFDGGTNYSSSMTLDTAVSTSRTFEFMVSPSLGGETGGDFNGFGLGFSLTLAYGHSESGTDGTSTENTVTYGYTLADATGANADDGTPNEYLSVDIKKPSDGFGPVFSVKGGASSCPYQGEDVTKYYQPGKNVLNQATLQIEKPDLAVAQNVVKDVPSNRAAEFTIYLTNNTETREDLWYTLQVDDDSNPYGALVQVDGSAIGNGRTILVQAGQTIQKVVKVYKGSSTQMDYENIALTFGSDCDANISVTKTISAYFLPGCSDISVNLPKDLWVVNTNTMPADTLNVKLDNYDLNYGNFKYVSFQYKPASTSLWVTDMKFYNPNQVTQDEFDAADEPKSWISGASISYPWNMHSLPDRQYQIRAKTVCQISPSETAETPTDIVSGIKDVKRPRLFGTPQPADGILSNGDDISIMFDEPIEASLLTSFNFSLKGVLNGTEIDHNTSINFDGLNDYASIADGLDLSGRSFTLEFWLRRGTLGTEQTIFSKGYSSSDAFQIGFDASNRLFVKIGTQTITSQQTFTSALWGHFGIVFNNSSKKISVFYNDLYILDNASVTQTYNGAGAIHLGKTVYADGSYFNGQIHDFRVWTAARNMSTVYSQMYKSLTGSEIGLAGYWPMDEAEGNKALDKARSRHALLFADWLVEPHGKSYSFDGSTGYVTMNTASTVVISSEMDYTIEFWFKALPGQTSTTMFSSGKGDGSDVYNKAENCVSIGFNEAGKLIVANGGYNLVQTSSTLYADNNWHHFAFVVSRNANATMLVDGQEMVAATASNFGGLSGATMWAGARGYLVGSLTKNFDNYFNGNLDEIRIWNLARKVAQIKTDKNAKLTGDETGLAAYYPFEQYVTELGIKLSKPTLADQWQNPYGANAGNLVGTGAAAYSDDAPNIKDARPVKPVDFDFTVNTDKIVITPSVNMLNAIEKTTLDITVQNVEDKYENRLSSPISWTAFINRNQLKWGDSQLSYSKKLYDQLSFTVDITNSGATEQNFKVENIPAWLTVKPSSGAISPQTTLTLTFTVNQGLNTGYFSEDLFLSGDFEYKEKLSIDLRVYETEPAWTVDKSNFQYSMNLIGLLEINGVLSTDKYDKVAVFVNNECRGTSYLTYIEEYDKYFVFMDIYSNTEFGEDLEFRAWDASSATEYRKVLPALSFGVNQIEGILATPTKLMAGDSYLQKVKFYKGWTWASFNMTSTSLTNLNTLMGKLKCKTGNQVKGQAVVDVYAEGMGWNGTISRNGGLKAGNMYMTYLSDSATIEIVGVTVDAATPVSISKNWNWIGYNPRFNMTPNEAFANFNPTTGDVVKSQSNFAMYDKNLGWIGSLQYLNPGYGYMYYSAKSGTLIYPATSLLSGSKLVAATANTVWKSDVTQHPLSMTIVAELEGNAEASLLQVGSFVNGECRGAAEATDYAGKNIFFINVSGEEDTTQQVSFKAIDPASGSVYTINNRLSFTGNATLGTLGAPYKLQLAVDSPVLGAGISAFPNPFDKSLTVYFTSASETVPYVYVVDVMGKTVATMSVVKDAEKGWKATLSSNNLASGVYFVKVRDGADDKWLKVVKN